MYKQVIIDGKQLTLLPALIDPHVHFRVPGAEHKEDWRSGALAAVLGGVTRVCDMPNNLPPCTSYQQLLAKEKLIISQLKSVDIPLRFGLYLGADEAHLAEIPLVKGRAVGLKIFMGCSTGGLVIDSTSALEEAFQRAAESQLLVAVHAEEEQLLKQMRARYATELLQSPKAALHSRLRPREAAIAATEKAIDLAARYKTPLYILHLSTAEEVALVRAAKKAGLPVYAEATTHHLFLSEADYDTWGTLVQMNPPLRETRDQEALWEALVDGTIDTLGTDHAPHTLEEKRAPYGKAPSGIPGVETLLPLMLDAVSRGRLTLCRLMTLTRYASETLFGFPPNQDRVLVDLELEKSVDQCELASKCGWSPYHGRRLKGWPCYTILEGRVFRTNQGTIAGKAQLEEYLLSDQADELLRAG